MWAIFLHKVRGSLSLCAARSRSRTALQKALRLAGNNSDLTMAIRMAVCEAEIAVTVMVGCDKNALSGPEQTA